jgi:carboxylate-amine ligase
LELLRIAHWTAARWGLDGNILDPHTWRPTPAGRVVDRLLAHTEAALRETGDLDLVRALLADVAARGTGARWQRKRYEQTKDWSDLLRQAVRLTAHPITLPAP